MSVKFRDYYDTLGVSREASQDDIRRAYRKLARKYHPDVNKDSGAEDRFKQINEAYEVLKDPEKREKYNQLGPNWQNGQDFRPPPDWDFHFDLGSGPGAGSTETHFRSGGGGGFSDFFEMLFGRQFREAGTGARPGGSGFRNAGAEWVQDGADQTARLRIGLEDAFHGATRTVTLSTQRLAPDGQIVTQEKSYEVKIPKGILPGQKIRLAGQGGEGTGGGRAGNLYLEVEIEPHPVYRLEGRDLYMDLPVTPWEAVLGAEIEAQTLSAPVTIKVPAGIQSGQKLRLRKKGMHSSKEQEGDLYAVVRITVPKQLTERERELFEELRQVSEFKPRR